MSSALLQQQNTALFGHAITGEIAGIGAWDLWSAETIASATTSPLDSVQRNWPLVYDAFSQAGLVEASILQAAIGTIAVETAHTFEPVREAYWLSEAWRQANLRYYPYYGRGFVQLTWDYNYSTYGAIIGVDLLNNPELAMQPMIAAECMVQYFIRADVIGAARTQDWAECRRRVQGAYAGLDVLTAVIAALPLPAFPPPFRSLAP